MSEPLLPCPFCESPAKLFVSKETRDRTVVCQNPDSECNARIPYCGSDDEATRQWNRRIPNPLLPLVRELAQCGCLFDDGKIPACPHNKQLQRQEWCLPCRADATLADEAIKREEEK
jgi:hypothetical protein